MRNTEHLLTAYFLVCFFVSSSLSDTLPVFSLTVTAKDRKVEISYKNIPFNNGDKIQITSEDPKSCISGSPPKWYCNNQNMKISYSFDRSSSSTYHKSKVTYKYTKAHEFNKNSKCHSFWAVYVNKGGEVKYSACLSVYPTWVNDLLPKIGNKRIRDLIIPGTHDSGSYKDGFNILSKYTIAQDETILGQLYQGARYIDIRPAYHKLLKHKWYVNHGISIQQPLNSVMEQVLKFVKETGEPVIFGLKEFPKGFKKNDTHRKLVKYMISFFGNDLIKPNKTNPWNATLNELMVNKNTRIILAYDRKDIVSEFSNILFPAVYQNWGNARKWNELEKYLRSVSSKDPLRLSDNPVADMAELTPSTKDVVFSRLGGLRQMADDVNLNLCDLYENELYPSANIIAVDFIRGTRITEMAIYRNGLL